MQGRLFLISSSSGAGKTSLAKSLVQKIGAKCNIERVVTYTTRPQGKSEVHGKDYHFLSDAQFEKGEQDGLFLEWSTSYEHVYASPASILEGLKQGKSYLLVMDHDGVANVSLMIPDAVTIWILVEDVQEIKRRLEGRGRDTAEQIALRVGLVQKENEMARSSAVYQYEVVNQNFGKACNELVDIVKNSIGCCT